MSSHSVPHWSVNAGVILVRPDEEIYNDIVTHFAAIGTNRNMGDQGIPYQDPFPLVSFSVSLPLIILTA